MTSTMDNYQTVLGNVARAGVYHLPQIDPAPLKAAATANGFAVFHIDLGKAENKAQMLDAIARAMAFPDWFGHNFDALTDCLTDMSWRVADGYFVLLDHCDGIHGRAESDFVTTLQVFENAANEWREQNVPLWCFVEMQADGINWLPDIP